MNFDYRGTIVQKSTPTPELRTVKKVLHIDSADRDTGIYYTNGEFVVYLPRVYEKVVSLRLMSAEFPTLESALTHSYQYGANAPTATFSNDTALAITSNALPNYFLVDIDGLNKNDETSVASQRSQYTDSFFAKIPNVVYTKATLVTSTLALGRTTNFIEYNDHTGQENVAKFSPPIGKLDRLRIRTRLHSQQGGQGFLYWTFDQAVATAAGAGTNTNVVNFCLTFEVEYLDNGFDKFSSLSTRLGPGDRAGSP
jgi:hypothetical protein